MNAQMGLKPMCIVFSLCLMCLTACSGGKSGGGEDVITTQPQAPLPVPPQNETTPPKPVPNTSHLCRRATEIKGGNFTFHWASNAGVGQPLQLTFKSNPKNVLANVGGSGSKSGTYFFVGPESGSVGSAGEIRFQLSGSMFFLGFPVIPFGTIEGDFGHKEYIIGSLSNSIDGGDAPFLCSKSIRSIMQ